MAVPEGPHKLIHSDRDRMSPDSYISNNRVYREEIIKGIDVLRKKLDLQKVNKKGILYNLKLMKMREEAISCDDLDMVEKELGEITMDIENPTHRMKKSISIIVTLYTLVALISFLFLTSSASIMLPSFNIPYSVLLMGLIGSLVSMYVKLHNIGGLKPSSYDLTVWFIINPPIAVVMAGIFFGIVQMFLPIIPMDLIDESWPYWILAWIVGLNNWVFIFEKISSLVGKTNHKRK
jgi:hypothetical protein